MLPVKLEKTMKQFKPEELDVLQSRYRFTSKFTPSPLSVQMSALMEREKLQAYLGKVKEKIQAANLTVAGSIFVKRYSYAVLIALYSMSVLNKRPNFSLSNVSLQTINNDHSLWLPSFKLHDLSVEEAPNENRNSWRDEVLKDIFAKHVEVLFVRIRKVSKLSKIIMWENLYIYIIWMYEKLLEETELASERQRISDDFHYILKGASGFLFGSYHENPFSRYNSEKQYIEKLDDYVYVRKTCCLSYLTEAKGNKCKTCPIVCRR